MAKKNLIRALALLMAVCTMAPLTACKDNSETFSSYYEIIEENGDKQTGEKDSEKEKDSSKTETAAKTKTKKEKKTKEKSTPAIDPSKPKTSLTRDQVFAKMPQKLRGTTVKYAYWWNPKEQGEGPAIAEFEKSTGIKVEPVTLSYWGFYNTVAAKIAAGDSPDIVRMMTNLDNTVDMLQPITNSGYDFNDTAWDETVLNDYTFNGKTFAVNMAGSAVMDYAVIYYNKDALKAAEMEKDDPYTIWKNNPDDWNWKKFWNMCDQFVKANKKSSETYYGSTFEYPDGYIRAMGGCIYTYDGKKGKFVNKVTSTNMKNAWKTWCNAVGKKWTQDYHDITLFDSGKILFYWSGPYSARRADDRQREMKDAGKLGVVPLPTDSKTQTVYEYTAFGIPKGAKNPEAAPYYLRWVLDQSSYDMNQYWINAEAKEVMDTVAKRDNVFYGAWWYEPFYNDVYAAGSSQVQTVLDAWKNTIDMTVKENNDRIKMY